PSSDPTGDLQRQYPIRRAVAIPRIEVPKATFVELGCLVIVEGKGSEAGHGTADEDEAQAEPSLERIRGAHHHFAALVHGDVQRSRLPARRKVDGVVSPRDVQSAGGRTVALVRGDTWPLNAQCPACVRGAESDGHLRSRSGSLGACLRRNE